MIGEVDLKECEKQSVHSFDYGDASLYHDALFVLCRIDRTTG